MTVDDAVRLIASAVKDRDVTKALETAMWLEREVVNTSFKRAVIVVIAALRTVQTVNTPYTWSICDSAVRNLEKSFRSLYMRRP
ncbi:hypothetical protein Theam_1749 (plasmid) [Thermovibrio ammonificans HB-1]|uniref:Uncharacterized protein n=1 Tax=Thermovibrio ammonificans (strain DSM 15698 / JCM 12110 / HB-1) TaxID=648996 RepID=E8T6Y4_THEA1|nr:hypothetical protein [Thermovibrio ammonificans]ADU97705.1 hypothetical protein Theam_1749 [Thermovibrio ammonificans HB-1]